MNSPALTEVATGAEARSTRRWLHKCAAPIALRYLALLVLVAFAALLFFHLLAPSPYEEWPGPCALGCHQLDSGDRDRDLLDLIF